MFFFIVGWRHWGLIFKLFIAVGFLGLITFAIVGVLKLACCKLKIRQQDAIGDDVVWQKNSMSDKNRSANSLTILIFIVIIAHTDANQCLFFIHHK